jgi:hypothetical protein
MSTPRERLKQALRHIAGIPYWGLTDSEFDELVRELSRISRSRSLTEADWLKVAEEYVRGFGTTGRKGENMADLNALLMQIRDSRDSGQSGPSRPVTK